MLKRDASDHSFMEVENIRITYVPAKDRDAAKSWAGADVLRVQAYRGSEDQSLHMGAELPIPDSQTFVDLVSALCTVYNEGRRAS